MRYYLDTEFNGFGGDLISLALVREDGQSVSYVFGCEHPTDWVATNVMPHLFAAEVSHEGLITRQAAARHLAAFLRDDAEPIIIADWPEDLRHLCDLIVIGPGKALPLEGLRLQWAHASPHRRAIEGAIAHNAWWDANALWAAQEGL